MTRIQLLTGGATAATLVVLASFAVAQTAETTTTAQLSAEDAIAIALELQPGTIGEAELDEYEGRPAYDIEVVTEAGEEVEFKVDAATGEVLSEWVDDDPTDDPIAGDAEETTN
ncbi:MAG: PepSY domain-containing protein [Pseudomonadota bacterium]